jgi:hypothetical protein
MYLRLAADEHQSTKGEKSTQIYVIFRYELLLHSLLWLSE